MFNRRAMLRAGGIVTPDMEGHRLAAMDVAGEAVLSHERLVLLRAIGVVRPDPRAGVTLVQHLAPELPSVMAGGIGYVPATDGSGIACRSWCELCNRRREWRCRAARFHPASNAPCRTGSSSGRSCPSAPPLRTGRTTSRRQSCRPCRP